MMKLLKNTLFISSILIVLTMLIIISVSDYGITFMLALIIFMIASVNAIHIAINSNKTNQ